MKRFAKLSLVSLILLTGFVLLRGTAPQVATGTWQSGSEMSEARTGAAAVTLDDGRVLVFGGTTAPDGNNAGATNAVQVFSDGSWSDLGAVMLDARSGHSATALADGRILLAGGENSSGPLSSLEIYYPWFNDFVSVGTLSGARQSHGAARLPDGRVLMIGGSDGTDPLASSEIYDFESGSVSAGPSLSAPRSGLSATRLLDGKILIAGGNNGEADLASTVIYDPADGSQSAGTSLSVPRTGHSAILLPHNNSVLISGGSGLSSAEHYVPWTDSVSLTGSMSAARDSAAGGSTAWDGVAIVAGGSGSQGVGLYGFATVKTDKDDYAPGEIVTITGSGWQPGETVTLRLQEDVETAIHDDRILTAVADALGNIANSEFAPESHDVGVRFYLTASGASSQAQTTFTDGQLFSTVSFSIGPVSVSPLAPLTWSASANCLNGGGVNTCISEGYISGSPVQNGYTLDIQQATNAAFTTGLTTRATVTTIGGAAGGGFTAPPAAGTYFYRARHPNQNLANFPPTGNDPNAWRPEDSASMTVVVVANATPTVTANNETFAEGILTPYTANWNDPGGQTQTHTCTINFGDGGGPIAGTVPGQPSGSGTCTASHTYADGPDSRTITVSVSDGSFSGSDTATATVNNLAPSITSVTNNGPINEGGSALITVTATDPAGAADPLSYQFDCNNDLTYEIGPQAGNTHSCSFADNGSFTVNVRVGDGDGGFDTESTALTVNNVAASVDTPVVTPEPSDEAASASVSATFSDPGADTHTCTVDFGDSHSSAGVVTETVGNPTTGSCSASHTYEDDSGAGTFTVQVHVLDDDGDTGTGSVAHKVNNLPPSISAVVNDGPVNEGSPAQITVTATDPAGAADPLSYEFDCNNDFTYEVVPQASNQGSCTFPDNGSFTVNVRVTDGDGGEDTDSTSVTVLNVAPANVSASPSSSSINENDSITLSGSFTDPGSADTHTVVINWGDGSSNTTLTLAAGVLSFSGASHQYLDDNPTGTASDVYSISVTVTDDDLGAGSGGSSVTVNNLAPAVTAGFTSVSVSCGANNATLGVSFTDVGTQDTHTATVNWGDGSPVQSLGSVTSPFNTSHTYASAGVYNAVVTVTDDDTGQGVDNTNPVTVNYTIVGGGVQPPINNDGTSVFKYKSTIPVKLKVQDCDGSAVSGLQISIMLTMVSGATPGLAINEPDSTSAADTAGVMRFDAGGQQYIYNLATKPLPDSSATYQIKLTIVSTGQVVTVNFGLKP